MIKTSTQKAGSFIGSFLVLISLVGLLMPGFFGLHLSLLHNIFHLITGGVLLWSTQFKTRALAANLSFGIFFILLGMIGFVLGTPGYPGVGFSEADSNLWRIIPDVLEFGASDHSFHFLFGATLSIASLVQLKRTSLQRDQWKTKAETVRNIVDVQRRKEPVVTSPMPGQISGTQEQNIEHRL
jgi:hypothetical protein